MNPLIAPAVTVILGTPFLTLAMRGGFTKPRRRWRTIAALAATIAAVDAADWAVNGRVTAAAAALLWTTGALLALFAGPRLAAWIGPARRTHRPTRVYRIRPDNPDR